MAYPNGDPFRLAILKKITGAFDEISGNAEGWNYDLRPYPRVKNDGTEIMQRRNFRGRVFFSDEDDPLPMTSVLEVVIPPDQINSRAPDNPDRVGDWDLMVQGFVEDDPLDPTDPAQYLLADVVKRLAQERVKALDYSPGGGIFGFRCITELKIGVGVVRPPDEISARAFFWLPISLTIAESLLDPYDAGNSN